MRNMRRDRHRRRERREAPEEEKVTPMEHELSRDDIEEGIHQWILGRNGERDRFLLRMYMLDGITYEEMQRRMDSAGYPLSIDRMKKIVRKRKEELFRHI